MIQRSFLYHSIEEYICFAAVDVFLFDSEFFILFLIYFLFLFKLLYRYKHFSVNINLLDFTFYF